MDWLVIELADCIKWELEHRHSHRGWSSHPLVYRAMWTIGVTCAEKIIVSYFIK